MEKSILGKLEWHFTVPTPYVFLVRYIKASLPADKEVPIYIFMILNDSVDCDHNPVNALTFYNIADGKHGVFPG